MPGRCPGRRRHRVLWRDLPGRGASQPRSGASGHAAIYTLHGRGRSRGLFRVVSIGVNIFMDNSGKTPPGVASGRSSGPQGTRLFSTAELRQYSDAVASATDRHASIHEPVLEGLSAGLQTQRFTLRAGRQTIGRGRDNDIVVDDPSVSTAHAWIVNQHGRYLIMNTLSTNGTFVNDRRIHEASLKHGDHIRLGQAELVFLTRENGAANPRRVRWVVAASALLCGLGALAWWLV